MLSMINSTSVKRKSYRAKINWKLSLHKCHWYDYLSFFLCFHNWILYPVVNFSQWINPILIFPFFKLYSPLFNNVALIFHHIIAKWIMVLLEYEQIAVINQIIILVFHCHGISKQYHIILYWYIYNINNILWGHLEIMLHINAKNDYLGSENVQKVNHF